MAQIAESGDKGKKKKGAQKKIPIHVDFTPMVDMNMLLLTFFMLCTSMLKSQTLKISLPTNEKVEKEQQNKAKESEAITLLLDVERDAKGEVKKNADGTANSIIYYYEGKPMLAEGSLETNIKVEYFKGNQGDEVQGIRKILHNKNKKVLDKIETLKADWRAGKLHKNAAIADSIYQAKAKEIRNDSTVSRPVVIIKPLGEATWESVITALDEMQINQIARYQIDNFNSVDSTMLSNYRKLHPNK